MAVGFDPLAGDYMRASYNMRDSDDWSLDWIERDGEHRIVVCDGQDRMLDRVGTYATAAEATLAWTARVMLDTLE